MGKGIFAFFCSCFVLFFTSSSWAEDFLFPVPVAVIYRGDSISEQMITQKALAPLAQKTTTPQGGIAHFPGEVIGKVARRTLLPGYPIALSALEPGHVVLKNTSVTLIYRSPYMILTTKALALSNGQVGETIQLRNIDSGQFVYGTVQKDGTVLVGGG